MCHPCRIKQGEKLTVRGEKLLLCNMHTEGSGSHLHLVESALVAHQSHTGVHHEPVQALPELLPWSVWHDPPLGDGGVITLPVHGVRYDRAV